jgi:hypothetical protein
LTILGEVMIITKFNVSTEAFPGAFASIKSPTDFNTRELPVMFLGDRTTLQVTFCSKTAVGGIDPASGASGHTALIALLDDTGNEVFSVQEALTPSGTYFTGPFDLTDATLKAAVGTTAKSKTFRLIARLLSGADNVRSFDLGPLTVMRQALPDEFVTSTPGATNVTLAQVSAIIAALPPGETGETGPPGADGADSTIAIGTVETGDPGTDAVVENVGTASAAILNMRVPRGAVGGVGEDGVAATITVGTVTIVAHGSPLTVTNVGTDTAAILNFEIPDGPPGADGEDGAGLITKDTVGAPLVTDGKNGDCALVGLSTGAVTFFGPKVGGVWPSTGRSLNIGPKGDKGDPGANGTNGLNGTNGGSGTNGLSATVSVGTVTILAHDASPTVTNSGTANAAVFNFGIPAGRDGGDGADGEAATVAVGTVTEAAFGTPPAVSNSGTTADAVLDFVLPAAAPARPILFFSAPPSNSVGVDGDIGIDRINKRFYGPKLLGAWDSGFDIVGPPGLPGTDGYDGSGGILWAHGPGAPDNSLNYNGDYCIDSTSSNLSVYLKTGGVYHDTGMRLKGDQGPAGPQGAAAPTSLTPVDKTADFSLTHADSGGTSIDVNSATNVNVTVPSTLTAGDIFRVGKVGVGNVTFLAGSGVTLRYPSYSGNIIIAQWGVAVVYMRSSAEAIINGCG